MPRHTYDHRWKEVQDINGHCMLMAYMGFVSTGIGFLVVTWTTVVLLGGFVSMIDKQDFWRLTMITLIQILGINDSFQEKAFSSTDLSWRLKGMKDLFKFKWQLTDNARGGRHPNLAVVKRVVTAARMVVGWVLSLVHHVFLLFCVLLLACLFLCGLFITTSLSIYGLVKHEYYGDTHEGRTNMYPAHNVVYVLCVAQGALLLYRIVVFRWQKKIVNQVSQAYGFQDGGRAVSRYTFEIARAYEKNPSSSRERNLITCAIELMESKSPSSCLSGTLILDRLLTRQYSRQIKAPTYIQQDEELWPLDLGDKVVARLTKKEKERMNSMEERRKKREEAIIMQQRTVIKRLIGSASSTHILQKLLDTLESKRSYDKRMREAAARIVEHVASGIRLEQFPRGINCISSLINNFEEYRRFQPDESSSSPSNTYEATATVASPTSNTNEKNGDDEEQGSYSSSESELEPSSEYSESEPESESYNGINRPSSSEPLNGYKNLVLTGLSILWNLTGSEENCIIISNTKHLFSKIMAPVSYDLVHRTHHSAWSTSVVEASMRVMLRLIATLKDTKGDTGADQCEQISINGAITTMEKIVTCEECKGGELQMTAMQILMQLRRCNFTKILVDIFIKGDCSDVSIKKTAGKELVLLFVGNKSVSTLLSKEENDEFVGGLTEIVLQVGNSDEWRKSAAEILEHMCIHYTKNDEYLHTKKENGEYLSTLKNAMTGAMPKVLREILLGCWLTGEERKSGYLRLCTDIESQVNGDRRTNNKKKTNKKKKKKKKKNNTSSSAWQNQHLKLYVALLSLYVTACEKLDLDIDAISPGEGDQGEGVAFRFATQMVQSNRDHVSADSLTVMKLSTRMVIATTIKLRGTRRRVVNSADLESLMDTLTSISETMLDLEGSMVFSVGTTMKVPATADTLDSLVKRARELHSEIRNQESEIKVSAI